MGIEGAQQACFVGRNAGLELTQGIRQDEERSLHRAVVAPKSDGTPRRIIAAAGVWEVQCHGATCLRQKHQCEAKVDSDRDDAVRSWSEARRSCLSALISLR